MPDFRIATLEVTASYHQINSTYSDARPTPQYISRLLFESIATILDLESAYGALRDNLYSGADAKAAATAARADVITKLNELSGGVVIELATAPYYRRTISGGHEIVTYVKKGEGGAPPAPWEFSLIVGDQTVTGFVCLSIVLLDAAEASMRGSSVLHSSGSVPKKKVMV